MAKKKVKIARYREVLWAIVGKHGLYLGTATTRKGMVREHVNSLYIIPTDKWPDIQTAWKDCRKKGDKAIRVNIEYEVKENVKTSG